MNLELRLEFLRFLLKEFLQLLLVVMKHLLLRLTVFFL